MPSLTSKSEYRTVAGVLAGSDAEHFVVLDEAGNAQRIRMVGPWYYVKKCCRPLATGPIILTDANQQFTSAHLVLAVGAACGRHRQVTRLELRDRQWGSRGRPTKCAPLDWVLVLDEHPTKRRRSPYGSEEWWVHEDIVLANLGAADPQAPAEGEPA